jgi:hypothetical protein
MPAVSVTDLPKESSKVKAERINKKALDRIYRIDRIFLSFRMKLRNITLIEGHDPG